MPLWGLQEQLAPSLPLQITADPFVGATTPSALQIVQWLTL